MFMEEKAQAALEYLLIIGAAVLVAAIVVGFISDFLPILMNQTNHEANRFFHLSGA
jgi:uncharacterized protein (UPF0333 family)